MRVKRRGQVDRRSSWNRRGKAGNEGDSLTGGAPGIKGGKVEILRRMATSLLPAALLCLRPGGTILTLTSLTQSNIPVQPEGLPDPQSSPPVFCPPLLPPPTYGGLRPVPGAQDVPSWVAGSKRPQQWSMSRRKRNPGCIRQCLRAGVLHPAQCHFLC